MKCRGKILGFSPLFYACVTFYYRCSCPFLKPFVGAWKHYSKASLRADIALVVIFGGKGFVFTLPEMFRFPSQHRPAAYYLNQTEPAPA